MERASREDGDQAMPVSWLGLPYAFSGPTASWRGAAWRVREGEGGHQKVAQRVSKSLSCFPESRAPPSGLRHLPRLGPGKGPEGLGQGLTWVKEPSSLHSGTNTASWGFLACSRA